MPQKRSKKQLQAGMFAMCYLSYSTIHVFREFWAISKPIIEANVDKYHTSKSLLSDVDTVNFMVYGLATFVSGAVGDAYPQRIVLPVSYALQGFSYGLIAFTGFYGGELTNE